MVSGKENKSLENMIHEPSYTIIRNIEPLGEQKSLAQIHEDYRRSNKITRQSHVLLVLLRHFAWLPWRDHVKDIVKQRQRFIGLNCQIIIVSFGNSHGCLKWYNENGLADLDANGQGLEHQFLMMSDFDRELYKYFNLKRSFLKVWNSQTLDYYAEQLASRRELPKSYKDVADDPHQMGGDFIFQVNTTQDNTDSLTFKPVLDYKSKTPVDRPSCQQLIEKLTTSLTSD